MNAFSFTIMGDPTPKGRPRFNSVTKHAFTPARTKSYEKSVQTSFMVAGGIRHRVLSAAVRMEVFAYFKRPKDRPVSSFRSPCLKTPDWDNIGKIVSDALNEIAYNDDKQIHYASVTKQYCRTHEEQPRVTVYITWEAP